MKSFFISFIISLGIFLSSCSKEGTANMSNSAGGNSTAGSMARFVLVGDYMYTINNQSLKTFNVSNPANPTLQSTVNVGPDIETIFPFKGNLFIGSSQTMYVYNLNNPAKPAANSATNYVIPFTARDPVVANDTMAYASVRSANGVGGSVLNIINIRNLQSPVIVNRLVLSTSSYGLGLADSALYLCESNAGMKVYSLKNNANTPVVRTTISNNEIYYDVIPFGNLLYTWIEGGNCIFDISNRMNPTLLSKTKN